ncbi:MAG: hypothetical protein LWY06_14620 [Firmicutes bacterium]|nr:hypothetical protein [Bacillota bacterium]
MLKIRQLQLRVILDKEDCKNIVSNLSEKYDLIIHGMKKEYIKRLGLKIDQIDEWIMENFTPQETKLLGGDLVYVEPDTVMYFKVPDEKELIEIGVVGNGAAKEFKDFAARIKSVISDALEDSEQEWEPVKQLNPSFNILVDNARTVIPGAGEVSAAKELVDVSSLSLMKIIMEKDSTFLDKLTEEVELPELDDVIKKFSDLGLVNSDFALLCSKTGQQLLRIPDSSALEDISRKGFRCFICGASYSDEKLVKSISCSDFGKKVLEDDYWFMVIALDALHSLGIPYEDCLIYTAESPDTNIFLNINNEAVMLQLSNRRLTLDDAYLINAHIAAYKLNYLILVSTSPVSALMKSHLTEANTGCSIHFIESLNNLAPEVYNILLAKEKKRLIEIMKNMSELTPAPIEKLLMKKLIPEGKIVPRTGLEDVLLTEFADEAAEIAASAERLDKDELVISAMSGGSNSDGFYYEEKSKATGKETV